MRHGCDTDVIYWHFATWSSDGNRIRQHLRRTTTRRKQSEAIQDEQTDDRLRSHLRDEEAGTPIYTHTLSRKLDLTNTLCVGQVAFIKQEAMEKAREIKVKADEEFSIEKVSHWLL